MIKTFKTRLAAFASGLLIAGVALAADDGAPMQHAGVDLSDKASLQRGAKLFVNYCSGCHSLRFLRYSRMAADLDLTEEQVMDNLNFTGAKFGDHMLASMPAVHAETWFGKPPPDLSLVVRSKPGGPDWVYTFLKSFYLDDSATLGWNNQFFPNVSMPNPLWEMQGQMGAMYGDPDATGAREVTGLTVVKPGLQNAQEFDRTVRDLTAFLTYASEPVATQRAGIGVWVILFLAVFTFLAWMLKNEFWKDVH